MAQFGTLRSGLLFTVATLCKTLEPIGVDLSSASVDNVRLDAPSHNVSLLDGSHADGLNHNVSSMIGLGWNITPTPRALNEESIFPFSVCVLVMVAEATKCVLLLGMWLFNRRCGENFSLKSSTTFGIAAVFLAAVNQLMMIGIALLGPLLYQIVFLATGTISAGVLSEMLLGEKLASMQWLSLGFLIVGFCLTLPGFDPWSLGSLLKLFEGGGSSGLAVTTFSGLLFSLQGALFEMASNARASQSVVVQSLQFAAFGFVANFLWFQVSREAASGFQISFRGFDLFYTWVAVMGIVLADVSMTFLFKELGSTTYSFSRAIATCAVGVYEIYNGTQLLSLQFVVGAIVVTLAAWLYKRSAPIK
eukprot:m.120153 g.120153  ORF g.120153 m.120153 type:complete len:362 (-) comp28791_c0_seq1:308-1393(-)